MEVVAVTDAAVVVVEAADLVDAEDLVEVEEDVVEDYLLEFQAGVQAAKVGAQAPTPLLDATGKLLHEEQAVVLGLEVVTLHVKD